jgi:hypothetical protein
MRTRCGQAALSFVLVSTLPVSAQLLPQVTPKPKKAPAPKPTQIKVNPKDGLKYVWLSPGSFKKTCALTKPTPL